MVSLIKSAHNQSLSRLCAVVTGQTHRTNLVERINFVEVIKTLNNRYRRWGENLNKRPYVSQTTRCRRVFHPIKPKLSWRDSKPCVTTLERKIWALSAAREAVQANAMSNIITNRLRVQIVLSKWRNHRVKASSRMKILVQIQIDLKQLSQCSRTQIFRSQLEQLRQVVRNSNNNH